MNDWMPSLNALRAFEAVARHLSYSDAAEELRVTPGAVKHLVTKLEASLNVKLLERQGRRMVLTPTGQVGVSDLALGMRSLSDAVQKMREHQTNTRLIISVEASLAATWLAPRLNEFMTQNPEIDVLLDASQKVHDLDRSDVDIAIRYGVERSEGFVSNRLFKDFVVPACSPSVAKGPPDLTSLEDLRHVPLIHWDTSHMQWAQATRRWFTWEGWLGRAGVKNVNAAKGKRFSDYGLAVQAAVSGQGVILAGWPALIDTMKEGLLVCPFADSMLETDIGFDLVTTPDARRNPHVRAFCEWLLGVASEVPGS